MRLRSPGAAWVCAGALLWLLLRFYQVAHMPLRLSDIILYKEWFDAIFVNGEQPYGKVAFPYPPLALLPFAVLAPFAPLDRMEFVRLFRFEMVCAEALIYVVVWFGFARLLPSARTRVGLIALIAACFSLQPHIVLDRLDAVVCLLIVACVPAALSRGILALVATVVAGMLYKFVPVFFALALVIAVCADRRQALVKAGAVVLAAGSALALLAVLDRTFWPGLWINLLGHAQRGIQIESVWASVIFAGPAFSWSLSASMFEVNYGAAHLRADLVPAMLLLAAKFAGFACYGLALLALHRAARAGTLSVQELAGYALALTWITCVGLQRVLSPQFFLWSSVAFAMLLASRPRRIALYVAVLAMTYASFDLLYPIPWYERLALFAVSSLLRNALLAALMALFVWDFFLAQRSARPLASAAVR